MDCRTPDLPVHSQHPEFTQTHVHWVGDANQPSHPRSSPFPPASYFPSIRVFSNESVLRISSVQFSHSVMSDSLRPQEPQCTRPPCPLPTPRIHLNPCPLSQWCHPTISSSVIPSPPGSQSFPASGSFQMSQLSTSGGLSIGVSASTSVLCIKWPKYCSVSFSISHSNEWSGLISFRMDWLDLLEV